MQAGADSKMKETAARMREHHRSAAPVRQALLPAWPVPSRTGAVAGPQKNGAPSRLRVQSRCDGTKRLDPQCPRRVASNRKDSLQKSEIS